METKCRHISEFMVHSHWKIVEFLRLPLRQNDVIIARIKQMTKYVVPQKFPSVIQNKSG